MLKKIVHRIRKTCEAAKGHPVAAELKARQQVAFGILHPQVQVVKNSPTVQIAFGTVVSGLLLTGNWSTAVVITGCWLGSKKLTQAVAGGVACVGLMDAKFPEAIDRLQVLHVEPV